MTEKFLQINDKYHITSDGSRNLILEEKYEKRDGKGKNAPLSGEFGYQTVGYFGAGLASLIKRFNDDEFLSAFEDVQNGQDLATALKEMREYLDERENRIYEFVNEKVTLNLKNTKGSNDNE